MKFTSPPDIGDSVRLTDEIISALQKEDPISHFIRFSGMKLNVIDVFYVQGQVPVFPQIVVVQFTHPFGLDNIRILLDGTIAGPIGSMKGLAVLEAWEDKAIGSDPKNNDGRKECFWCPGILTQKRGGGKYDVCPQCGR